MPDYIDEYGGDLQDPSQRCKHGTFIGSWAGPDYLCGWCESGEDPEPEPEYTLCDWEDSYTDFDGSPASEPCGERAKHTLVTDGFGGVAHTHLCSHHAGMVWDDEPEVDDDGTIWMDKSRNSKYIHMHIGKVVLQDGEGWDPKVTP